MAFDPGMGTAAALAVAVTTFAVGAFVLFLDFESRVHRAFGMFLILRALLDGSIAFTHQVDDLAGRLRVYLFIAIPFAAAHFAFVYRRRYGRPEAGWQVAPWKVQVVLLAVTLVFEGLYLSDHRWFIDGLRFGPLAVFTVLPAIAYAGLALAMATAARLQESRSHRRALNLAALGLALEPAFYAVFRCADLGLDLTIRGNDVPAAFPAVEAIAYAVALVLIFLVVVATFRGARTRWTRRRLAVLWSGAVVSGAGIAAVFASPLPDLSKLELLRAGQAIWTLFLPLLVTYALVRHRLFDVDVKVRFAIKGTTLAAVFLAVFFVVSKVAENLVSERFAGGNRGVYVGGVVAGLLLFAIHPLQKVADRFAHRAIPVGGPAHGSPEERLQLYREQLEIAWADGRLTTKERLLFARLQERLGIGAEDAARAETEVLAALVQPRRRRPRRPASAAA